MASLFSEALDFGLTKAGKDSNFTLKTEQKSIFVAVVDFFTPVVLSQPKMISMKQRRFFARAHYIVLPN